MESRSSITASRRATTTSTRSNSSTRCVAKLKLVRATTELGGGRSGPYGDERIFRTRQHHSHSTRTRRARTTTLIHSIVYICDINLSAHTNIVSLVRAGPLSSRARNHPRPHSFAQMRYQFDLRMQVMEDMAVSLISVSVPPGVPMRKAQYIMGTLRRGFTSTHLQTSRRRSF